MYSFQRFGYGILCCLALLAPLAPAHAQWPAETFQVGISTGAFIPEASVEADFQGLQGPSFEDKYFRLVQFYQIPSEQQRRDWAQAGLILTDYLPGQLYFAVIHQRFNLSSLRPLVRAILPVDARFKKEHHLYFGGVPTYARQGQDIRLILSYYAPLSPQAVMADLQRRGVVIELRREEAYQLEVRAKASQLEAIVELPYIQFVEAMRPEPELENYNHRNASGRSNFLNTGFNGLNINGDGVVMAVGESGTADNRIDFRGRLTEQVTGALGSHKIDVMTYMGGAGNYDPTDRGLAWGAGLMSVSSSPNYSSLYTANNLRYTNHSLGYGITAGYSSDARAHDLRIASLPNHLVMYSAGNSGTSAGFAPYNNLTGWGNITGQVKQNKNQFAAGSLNASDALMSFSSRGPTYDGRVYPQLVIEGDGGTSFAAPKMAGCFAILSQAFRIKNGVEPPSSLLRAILMNTADEMDNPGPDFKTGYGRPNLRRAYQVIDNGQHIVDAVSQGGSNSHTIAVPAGTVQVRVMIVWPDVAAAVNANPAIVNNLNLVGTSPSGSNFNPWVLNPAANATTLNTPATRGVDNLNTMEQITVDNPAAGNWTFTVTGATVPTGPQTYYLVYEFVQDQLLMAYPLQDEKFVPGRTYYLKWDSYGATGSFTLEYQLDGGAWTNITTVTNTSSRTHTWVAPNTGAGIRQIKFRVRRGTLIAESQTNYIGAVPAGLDLDWVCGNLVKLRWNAVPGATGYKIYRLGTRYMEEVTSNITFNGTTALLSGQSTTAPEYYAVSAVTGANEGLRCLAFTKPIGNLNCDTLRTTLAGEVNKSQILLRGIVNPHGTSLSNIRFEYGPTTSYGSSTPNISITATGHDDEAVSFAIPSNLLSRTQVLNYRLVAELNGQTLRGQNRSLNLAPGQHLNFDGTNDYLDLSAHPNLPVYRSGTGTAYTLAFWIKGTAPTASQTIYAESNDALSSPRFALLAATSGNLSLQIINNSGGTVRSITSAQRILDNTWHHVAWVDSNGITALYVDGQRDGTSFNYTPQSIELHTASLGARARAGTASGYFRGRIDEFSAWHRALSQTEVRAMMHQPLAGTEGNLRAYLRFDDGAATEVWDVLSQNRMSLVGGLSKTNSAAPFGVGALVQATEAAGTLSLGATDLTMQFISHNSRSLIASKIQVEPNATQGIPANEQVLDEQYWVMHRSGASSGSNANLQFQVVEDLDSVDQLSPCRLKLYVRGKGQDSIWTLHRTATAADALNNRITFNGLTDFNQQFIITRLPSLSASLSAANTQACEGASLVLTASANFTGTGMSYQWTRDGQTLTNTGATLNLSNLSPNDAGTYRVVISDTCGVVTTNDLVIRVLTASTSTSSASTCQASYVWNGQTYTTAGTYTWTGVNAQGCDSVATLQLSFDAQPDTSISLTANGFQANQTGASYQWLDCDNGNAPIAGATSATFQPTAAGNYAVSIQWGNCTAQSACLSFVPVGLSELAAAFRCYPNPSRGTVQLELPKAARLRLVDVLGRVWLEQEFAQGSHRLELGHLPKGLYWLDVSGMGSAQSLRLD